MKRIAALLTFVTILSCVAALATSNPDPKIIIKDPVCSKCTSVGTHFTFTSPAGGTGVLMFTNGSGAAWHSLALVESGVPANLITCSAPNTFMTCTKSTVNGVTTILFSGVGTGFAGITAGHSFEMSFGRWPASGLKFTASANVPEPGTLALFITGLGALISRRKKLIPQL